MSFNSMIPSASNASRESAATSLIDPFLEPVPNSQEGNGLNPLIGIRQRVREETPSTVASDTTSWQGTYQQPHLSEVNVAATQPLAFIRLQDTPLTMLRPPRAVAPMQREEAPEESQRIDNLYARADQLINEEVMLSGEKRIHLKDYCKGTPTEVGCKVGGIAIAAGFLCFGPSSLSLFKMLIGTCAGLGIRTAGFTLQSHRQVNELITILNKLASQGPQHHQAALHGFYLCARNQIDTDNVISQFENSARNGDSHALFYLRALAQELNQQRDENPLPEALEAAARLAWAALNRIGGVVGAGQV